MAFRIDDFRAKVSSTEFLRNNKFHVRIPYPAGLNSSQQMRDLARYMEFYTDSADLPGVAMKTHRLPRYGYGPVEQRPHLADFVDANISVLNDGDNKNLNFFRNWAQLAMPYNMSKGINNEVSVAGMPATKVFTMNYRDQFVTDVRISVFNEQGIKKSELVLREAFPVFIETVKLNWGDTNAVQKFTVTLAYFDWFDEINIDNTPQPPGTPGIEI